MKVGAPSATKKLKRGEVGKFMETTITNNLTLKIDGVSFDSFIKQHDWCVMEDCAFCYHKQNLNIEKYLEKIKSPT